MKKKSIFLSILLSFIFSTIVYANNKYQPGVYKVGIDIPSGEYILFAENGTGYFAVSSDSNQNDILFNDNFKYNSIIAVQEGEYVNLSRCYAVPFSDDVDINTSSTGMFKVGTHIPSGEYKLESGEEKGYYCIYADSRHSEIIANDNFDNQTYVTVTDGQYLLLNRCHFAVAPKSLNSSVKESEDSNEVIDQGEIVLNKDNLQPVLGKNDKRCVYVKECKYTKNKSDICITLNEDDYSNDGDIRIEILGISIDGVDVEFKNNSFGTPTNGTFYPKFYVSLEELQKLKLTDFKKVVCDITVTMNSFDGNDAVYNTELVVMREAFYENDGK